MRLRSLLVVLSLAVPTAAGAAINRSADLFATPPANNAVKMIRMQALNAAAQSVGECFTEEVRGSPGFADALRRRNLTDLIVAAAKPCRDKSNNYIQAFDVLHGGGGEDHFMDNFVGKLPAALLKYFTDTARQ